MRPFLPPYVDGDTPRFLSRLLLSLIDVFSSLVGVVDNEHIVTATLGTTDVRVFHGLDSAPRTIDVVGLTAGEAVYESPTTNSERKRFVLMRASGPVTATLRFN